MKKLLSILLLLLCQFSFAQLEIIGSKEYGSLLCLTYDPIVPNKIYAVTYGNHMVVSEDNGENWSVFYTIPSNNFDQKWIGLLKFHTNNLLSYVVGELHGNKIYILDINSKQIIREYVCPIPDIADNSNISSYAFYNDDTIIVQQHFEVGGALRAKVYYTNDGGNSWDTIYYNIEYGSVFPNGVYIAPNNPQKLFIARHGGLDPADYGGLLISVDAGQTWEEKLSGVDLSAMAFHPNNPDDILLGSWYASFTQNLYQSLDGGNHWDAVDPNWSNEVPGGIFVIKYNPTDVNHIIVTGLNEIVRTYDNFQTKEVIHYENDINNVNNYYYGSHLSFNPFNTSQLLIVNNDYSLMTNDGGATVSKIDIPYFFSQNGQLNFFKNSTGSHLYYSVHNGFSHRNLSTQAESAYLTVPLQFLSNTYKQFYCDEHVEGRIYGSFQGPMVSGIGVSNDHGENVFGFQSPKIYMHEIISEPSNPNILFCSLSDDWAHCDLVRFDISDVDNIQQTTIALPEQGFLSDIHFDINNNVIWIALENHIYKSNDNGLTWTPQNLGLELLTTDDVIKNICQNPLNPSQLTIATTKGVFTSTNQGESWNQLSSFYADHVKHSESNDSHLVAITYDGEFSSFALWLSNDQGNTWNEVERENLLYVNSDRKNSAVHFDGNSAVFYIGTYDLGVLKYTIDLTTLGQSEFENNLNVITSPNPAKNIINVQTTETIKEVSVYNLLGKKVTINQLSTNSIDVSNLAQGMYIIKVMNENDKTFSSKFIKE